jgi:bifunctional DNA-binding transcriptional regulator/antitoxin component of YhaV-PrlF toxin-antitoxin module
MKHGSSGVVVLPKAYRDYHDLNPGDDVTILYDSLLLIIPQSQEDLATEKADLIDDLLGQKKQKSQRM